MGREADRLPAQFLLLRLHHNAITSRMDRTHDWRRKTLWNGNFNDGTINVSHTVSRSTWLHSSSKSSHHRRFLGGKSPNNFESNHQLIINELQGRYVPSLVFPLESLGTSVRAIQITCFFHVRHLLWYRHIYGCMREIGRIFWMAIHLLYYR